MKFASRIDNLPPYVFSGLAKKIADKRAQGETVINFAMGDPDLPMPENVVESVANAVHDPKNHRYPPYVGLPELRSALCDWYGSRFGVELNPTDEVLPLIGSKEGIANLARVFSDPNELALIPNPGYPTYMYGTIMADGGIADLPLCEENNWLPRFDDIPTHVREHANVMWLNYPNNPTGAVADMEFFEEAVAFAKRYDIIICHDNPYCDVTFDGYKPGSILQVPGAKDVAIELNSLSKTYSMAGLRIGMAMGNATVIEALSRIKSQTDSGVPTIVQRAAVTALTGDQSVIDQHNAIYQARRDKLVAALNKAGIKAPKPQASLYIWAKVPEGYTSASFSNKLFEDLGIMVTPGGSYGSNGEGYIRLSITASDAEVDQAVAKFATLSL